MILGEDELSKILDCEKVVSFAHEARKRGKSCGCLHQRFVIDEQHGTVECAECGDVVSAFHAMCEIAKDERDFRRQWASLKATYNEMLAYKPWLVAVRKLERIWRGKRMLPCCPQCGRGLEAEELLGRSVGIDFEMSRRKAGRREGKA
jgi:hypothetical protein